MDLTTRTIIGNLRVQDREVQNQAFMAVLALTDQPVDWAYKIWEAMLAGVGDKDNHIRAGGGVPRTMPSPPCAGNNAEK